MTALLTDNLPLLAGAPNGMKKLRELILELAVRGKLVPQDPNDEPASELLKRIAEEKAGLVAEGKIKKQKPLPEIDTENLPFSLPANWQWVRLGDSLEMINGRAFKPTDWKNSGLPIVRIQNLNRADAPFNYCDESDVDGRHIIGSGSILISWSGTPGTSFGAFIWSRGRAALNQHIFSCFQKGGAFFDRFLVLAINTRLDELIAKAHGGVGLQHVTKGKLEALTLVVPPLAEQHRIVAKVDELMALCDRLEAQQADAKSAHAQLVQALLDSVTQAADAEDFAASWQRLAEHFHTLFTTEPSIDALKQALLQLAVMGKLVPQDASDAPASEQLKRVELEKQATFNGRNRVEKLRPADADDEKPFTLPSQWVWARLGELAVNGPSNGFSPKPASVETPYRCLTLSATTRGVFNNQCFKFVDIDTDTARKYFLKNGDLLIQRANSIDYVGVSAIYDGADDQFIFPDLIMRIKISECLDKYFIHCYLSSVAGRAYFRAHATGTQGNMPKINQGTVVNAPVPIPPLAEQHRIVAKVDQLMALCDQLKTRLTQARHFNEQLASALVAQAVA
ncbi:restriction endonuclease subunit S [Pseudomonas sp.]|uniref:restriction endonuclease subunit S n=1 Tax=Pseudomonas sp. TaxID=306 RepID=UPI0028A947D7|nr:restriction endonuclease subunit S [Pseudomonas sp.]